ncbi:hypothetical protein EBN03_05025 [Nocardia stercoris]|uniref:Uncharacterized protein n=2 Tax=Nocardia stercoris TaxID=2483361 RepID=A0A3M2LFJ6_9NOCA|nr:hypothetical protein EBN03_05025 [Nocardia stercoris]
MVAIEVDQGESIDNQGGRIMVGESFTALQDRVVQLREILRTAKDFVVPWRYFHDELAMNPNFLSTGGWATSPLIDAAIEQIAQTRGWDRPPGNEPTICIPELEFWHGLRSLGGGTGIFFYDEHSCQGLLGVMTDPAGPVDLFRLTTLAFPA